MTSHQQPLASRAAWGVLWAFFGTAAGKLVWLAATVVLARLLAPRDFGLFAFGLVFLAYVETIGDLGTGAALVYWPRRTAEVAQVTFAANLAMGVGWFLLAQLAAPAVATFFGNPEGEAILRLLAVSFLLRALGNTHDALCQKELRFKARLVPELALGIGKAILAVVLAAAGFGVWSLVWGQLLGLALWTAGLWAVVPWRPGLHLPRELVAPMFRYGRGIVAVKALSAVIHHADLVVVGRMLGVTALGFYQMAAKVPEITLTMALWMASKVLFPTFARLHAAGEDLARGYLAALRWVALASLPAAVGLVLVAEPLVATLFGASWRPAVPILQGLAVAIGLRSLGTPAGDLLKATGRSGLLAGLGVIRAALLLPALIVAGRESAAAVAATMAAVSGLGSLLNGIAACRLARVPLRRVATALGPCVLATTVLALVLGAWVRWGPAAAPALTLSARVAVGAAAYLAALAFVDREVFTRIAAVFRDREAPPDDGWAPVEER
ncbi:MAG TPA: lipopolysaccharide biosynthesis protein [Thermoanaerobaculia bacterium]|nr:lipopolysaccharide biosynthesis protein [Thermoanaerobaculia bacterium]